MKRQDSRQTDCCAIIIALWCPGAFQLKSGNAVEVWRGWAKRVEASICDAGHFVMEENPEAMLAVFKPFFVP